MSFKTAFVLITLALTLTMPLFASEQHSYITSDIRQRVVDSLVAKYGAQERARMNICVPQAASYWSKSDGSVDEFYSFCLDNFIADKEKLSDYLLFIEKTFEECNMDYIHKMILPAVFSKPDYYKFFRLYRPEQHFSEDMFNSKIAFVVLLNFPIVSLEDMSRKNYFWMKEFTGDDWAAFRLVRKFTLRIPAKVILNSFYNDCKRSEDRFLHAFKSQREIDSYCNLNKTFIERTFNDSVEISENKYENMLKFILSSKEAGSVFEYVKNSEGFLKDSELDENKLSRVVSEKYENISDLKNDINVILLRFGFSKNASDFLTDNITIMDSEYKGYDFYKTLSGQRAFLWIDFGNEGLLYPEYKRVISDLGGSVSCVYSEFNIDRYFLKGFPNSAFPAAISKIFEINAPKALGIRECEELRYHCFILNTFAETWIESLKALHSLYLWKWAYANPEFTESELHKASKDISDTLKKTYSISDETVLETASFAVYNKSEDFNKPLIGIIASLLYANIKDKNMAQEIERISSIGCLTPEVWIQKSTGSELTADVLLNETSKALKYFRKNSGN